MGSKSPGMRQVRSSRSAGDEGLAGANPVAVWADTGMLPSSSTRLRRVAVASPTHHRQAHTGMHNKVAGQSLWRREQSPSARHHRRLGLGRFLAQPIDLHFHSACCYLQQQLAASGPARRTLRVEKAEDAACLSRPLHALYVRQPIAVDAHGSMAPTLLFQSVLS